MTKTIKDVAKLAKVAPSTVSRVIANSPRISEKTKKIVREAMAELGYYPNHNARSLANRETKTIGLIMPSADHSTLQNPFFPEVIRGISTKAREQKYGLHMTTATTYGDIYEEVTDMVFSRRVDGVILLYSRVDDQVIEFLLKQRFPFTVVGKPHEHDDKITYIDNDNYAAASEACSHLINLGHRCIGFVGGSRELIVTEDRLQGYIDALKMNDLYVSDDYAVHQPFIEAGGREAMHKLMSLAVPPTGLVVADDILALGIVNALSDSGLRVPDDISIVSFNNLLLAQYSTPSLTSIDINIFQLGCKAVTELFRLMDDKNDTGPRHITVPHHLVERQSCLAQNPLRT